MTITQKLLLFLIAYLPFQLALNLAPDIDLASGRVFILVVFGLWILGSLASKKFKIVSHLATYLILFFLFLSLLSLTQGVSLERGLRKILVFASCFPIYFLVTGVGFEKLSFNRTVDSSVEAKLQVAKIMIFSGLIVAIIGLVQFFSQFLLGIKPVYQFWAHSIAPIFLGKTFTAAILANPSWLVDVGGKTFLRATSLFPDPHIFSFYLGLVIPLAFASLFYCKKHKILLFAVFCLLFIAQLLTFSRGGYSGLVITLPFMVLFLWKILGLKAKISIVIFILIGLVTVFTLGLPVVNRATSIFNLKEPSTFGRFLIWRDALDIFRDFPFLGVGIGSYSYLINPAVSYRAPIYAHNTYLDIAVEMGIFALIVWIGIFIAALRGLWGISRKVGVLHATPLRILSVGLMGSLVWFSIHSLVDTPIYSPRILPILMVILGLSVVVIKSVEK